MISAKKSVLTPTTKIEYLGFIINSLTMTVIPTTEKVKKLKKAVKKLIIKDTTTIRHVAQVTGGLVATHPGNPMAPRFTKQLEIEKIAALTLNKFDFDTYMPISDLIKTDLQWWLDNLDFLVARIHIPYPDFTIHTDASLQGYGFFVPTTKVQAGSRWSLVECDYHINILELLAIQHALSAVCTDMSHIHIRIMCDNTTAIAAITKQGSTRIPELNTIARQIWDWALYRDLWLSAVHIPGIANVEADEASRIFKDELEWTLNASAFAHICETFGTPTLDLFASRLNYRILPFCAFRPDPLASVIDAFTIPWNMQLGYAFPPFCLLGRILQKIIRDEANIILIVPDWPTKAWYPMFHRLLLAPPLCIPVLDNTLFLSHRMKDPSLEIPSHTQEKHGRHPLARTLKLLVGHLSGKVY